MSCSFPRQTIASAIYTPQSRCAATAHACVDVWNLPKFRAQVLAGSFVPAALALSTSIHETRKPKRADTRELEGVPILVEVIAAATTHYPRSPRYPRDDT